MTNKVVVPDSLEELKQHMSWGVEVDFYLQKQRWLLEPFYDDNSKIIGWVYSTDNGNFEHKINSTNIDKVLDYQINKNGSLKDQWMNMDLISF